jgi:hypothetical protein
MKNGNLFSSEPNKWVLHNILVKIYIALKSKLVEPLYLIASDYSIKK